MVKTYYQNNIDTFIEKVIDEVIKCLDPELILMAGSFGKGSWLFADEHLLSDFEFVFVCKKKWSITKKRKLLRSLNETFDFDINLKGFILSNVEKKIISSYATGNPGYLSLEFYDTFHNPEVLYKRKGTITNFQYDSKEIAVWEGWRLFANRIAHLIEIKASAKSKHELSYIWLKLLESAADAYLIVNQLYDKNISKRIEVFDEKILIEDKKLSAYCKASYQVIISALKARERHDIDDFSYDEKAMSKRFVTEWMSYFDEQLAESSSLIGHNWKDLYSNLIKDRAFQNQFSELNYSSNIVVSNMIRLLYNRQLFGRKFKFYNLFLSWQHTILLAIVSYYREDQDSASVSFQFTKQVMTNLVGINEVENLTESELATVVLSYWKALR